MAKFFLGDVELAGEIHEQAVRNRLVSIDVSGYICDRPALTGRVASASAAHLYGRTSWASGATANERLWQRYRPRIATQRG